MYLYLRLVCRTYQVVVVGHYYQHTLVTTTWSSTFMLKRCCSQLHNFILIDCLSSVTVKSCLVDVEEESIGKTYTNRMPHSSVYKDYLVILITSSCTTFSATGITCRPNWIFESVILSGVCGHCNIFTNKCGPILKVMAALPNVGGALCSTPQRMADTHYRSAVQ